MAEIITPTATGKKRNTRCNKQSTRVDLTPMVDLGFLLITFFIFTTSLSNPKALFLPLPDGRVPESGQTQVSREKTLQLILDGPNHIRYYHGDDSTHIASTDYSTSGLRKIVREKIAMVKAAYNDPHETVVIIRPGDKAIYGNVVDVLDEMMINDISKYMLLD